MIIKKINNSTIRKIKVRSNKSNWSYKNIFDKPYFNACMIGQTMTGKTNIIYNLLFGTSSENKKDGLIQGIKHHPEFNTYVYIYCSTFNQDLLYKKIEEKLLKYKIEHSIIEDYDNIKEQLKNMLIEMEEKKNAYDMFLENHKKYKQQLYPLFICIFDDFSMTDKFFYTYMRQSRHLGIINLLALHVYKQLIYPARQQLNYLFILESVKDYLKNIYDNNLSNVTSEEEFIELYNNIKKDNVYNFLFINMQNHKIRINLNYEVNFK